MSENLKKFLEFVGNDPALIEKAKQLKGDDPEKAKEIAITFAKENGFELTEADFEVPEGELSVDELKTVTGGGECYCAVGGGGTAKGDDNACGCVALGFGTNERTKDDGYRCFCSLGGWGGIDVDQRH